MNLFVSLRTRVDNMEKNYDQFVDTIAKIVNSYKSFKEAAKAILEYEPRLTLKDVFVAYNISKGELIPQAKSIIAYETVKFLAEEAPIKQQEKMLKAGVLVCSRKHPEGHLVSLYELKHCQIRYAWNYQKSRPMTKQERLEFSKQEFTAAVPSIEIKKPKTPGRKPAGVVKKNADGTYSFTGSFLAGDIDAWLEHLGESPISEAIDPCAILAGIYAIDWRKQPVETYQLHQDTKHSLTIDTHTREVRIVLHGNYSVSELFLYIHDACVYEMCWKIVEHYPTIFSVINAALKSDSRFLDRLHYADNFQAVKNHGGFPDLNGKSSSKKVKNGKKSKTSKK